MDISIAIAIVVAVVVIGDGMVAGMVVAMHFITTIAVAIVVPADETRNIFRCFIASVLVYHPKKELSRHTDMNSLAHLPCRIAYSARIEWLRAEAVELGGGGAGWVFCVLGYSSLRTKQMLVRLISENWE